MKSVSKDIFDRIVRAKYIFIYGVKLLDQQAPVKEGLALLAFHDALEMMLRAVAEHYHVSLKPNEVFDSLVNKIEEAAGFPVRHRSALLQLNKARAGFKHHGLLPHLRDVEKFGNDQEEFYSHFLSKALGLDFWALSLADLVKHCRARNWLKKAEGHFSAERFSDAVDCAAASLAIFRQGEGVNMNKRNIEMRIRGWREGSRDGGYLGRGLAELAQIVDERVADLEDRLDWVASGASFEGLQRFLDLAPDVRVAVSGKLYYHHIGSEVPMREESLFCIAFVTETLVQQQDQYRRDPLRSFMTRRTCRVVDEAPIQLFLGEEEVEEVRVAQPGEELLLHPRASTQKGYTAILQDGVTAYVESRSIKSVE